MKRLIVAGVLVVSAAAWADDVYWTGEGDGATWNSAANWNPQQVPTAADNAIFEKAATLSDTANVHGELTVRNGVTVKVSTETVLGPSAGENAILNVTGTNSKLDTEKLTIGGANGGSGKVVATNNGLLYIAQTNADANRLTVAAGAVPASGDVIDVAELGPGDHRIARIANLSAYPARISFLGNTTRLRLMTSASSHWKNSISTANWIFHADAPAAINVLCPPNHYLTPSGQNSRHLTTTGTGLLNIEGAIIYSFSASLKQTGGMTVAKGATLVFVKNGVEMRDMRGQFTLNGALNLANNPFYADGLTMGSSGVITTTSTQDFVFGSGDRDGSFAATTPSSNRVVKVGMGTLTVTGASSTGAFALSNGTLKVTAATSLASLTMEADTTLVVDGADLSLGNLVQHGAVTVTTVNGGRILYGGSALTEIVRPTLGGDFVKVGSATTTIFEPVSVAEKLHISEGELAFSKYGLAQRYWKWTFKGVSGGALPLTALGKVWLHGADGNRVGDGIQYATYSANADLTAKDAYKGKATWLCSASTNVKQKASYESHQDCFSQINHLFDYTANRNAFPNLGSPVINKADPYSHLGLEIRFRDSDGPIVGYNFGLTTNNGKGRPTDWTVETSDDGVVWTTVDVRSDVALPPETYAVFYDGTTYVDKTLPDPPPAETFHIMGYLREGLTPLATPFSVQIDADAKLNLKAFTGGQTVGTLTYDAALGAGEIENAVFATNGTLYYTSASGKPARGTVLPYVLTNCSGLDNLATWSVVINGKATAWRVSVQNGQPTLVPPGLVIVVE